MPGLLPKESPSSSAQGGDLAAAMLRDGASCLIPKTMSSLPLGCLLDLELVSLLTVFMSCNGNDTSDCKVLGVSIAIVALCVRRESRCGLKLLKVVPRVCVGGGTGLNQGQEWKRGCM